VSDIIREPITYESVTAGMKKRRVASSLRLQSCCAKCHGLMNAWNEEYRSEGRRPQWMPGRRVGEICTRCGWSFEYDDTEAVS
jgi:hypothetical protein